MKSKKKNFLTENKVSRRDFLKTSSVLGASTLVASCGGGGGGGQSYLEEIEDAQLETPEISGKLVKGAAPHNCGGRCSTSVYVEDGVIQRIVTDETEDLNLIDGQGHDKPQKRACIRCRSNKQRFYRSDRILYPLKQTGERGDVNGFQRISWEQAFSEIAEKTQSVIDDYGPKALYNHYASGDGSEVPSAGGSMSRLLNKLGGHQEYRSDYSWPSLEHTSWFFFGQNFYFPPQQSRQDALDSDVVVVWSGNFAESIWGTNTAWYMQQFKEMGKEVIVLDSRVSMTAATMASEFISVVPGTDSAVLQAMMHEMIVQTYNADGTLTSDPWLDESFIRTYTHGFYDDPAPTLYHDDVDNTTYVVPNGASLSAYIMGTDDRLVQAGVNGGTSIYPDEIGYNSYDTRDATDPLRTATVPIYSLVPKTPEWAEEISGVPASTIRSLAQKFAKKKVSFWLGGGWQRQSEGEQGPLNAYTVGAITGQFGEAGRHTGTYTDRKPLSFGLGMDTGNNAQFASLYGDLYDTTKLTTPIDGTTFMPKYSPAVTVYTFPVFLWPDVAKNGGTGESDHNDGQVKRMTVGMKALFNFGGNCLVNQCGNYNEIKDIISDRSKIELIVLSDQFMTPSAKFADYILPAATAYEKEGACSGWLAGDALTCMNKAMEPLGEALPDYDIVTGIATAMGVGSEFTEGKTADDWRRESVEPLLSGYFPGTTYEEWKELGTVSMDESHGVTVNAEMAAFRADPVNNPLLTPSGKLEIYNQAMVEDYEARGYVNIDGRFTLTGNLHDGSNAGRFVYPIPMVIPMMEGLFAEGATHPDPLERDDAGYTLGLNGWHIYYRSHSTHNNNAYINEVFKKNSKGQPAFLDPNRETGEAWDDNVYEPVVINPYDAEANGITDGDRVVLENSRGSIYASATISQRVRKGWLAIGQGGWANGDNANGTPDIGGAINVLTKLLPARICQGMTLGADTRVKIRKA